MAHLMIPEQILALLGNPAVKVSFMVA